MQVLLTVVLTNWGEAIQLRFGSVSSHVGSVKNLCLALNGPGLVFGYAEILISPIRWIPHGLGLFIDSFLYLLAVALLLVLPWATIRSVGSRHSYITLESPDIWPPVSPFSDPVGAETLLFGA